MTKTEIVNLARVDDFVGWTFNVYPGERALPEYWRQTNRAEQSSKLATIHARITAEQLSDYALAACAKGFKPWRYEFLKTVDDKILVDFYPISPDAMTALEHIAEWRLIDDIERGATEWTMAHAKLD